ncbi:putative G-protein coupled receptor B0563.6 [Chionoecetes opilio]|uniref:Putative G-protein coupled receptor B0563.6 n=1 Tax=Chionoecetes opilio TaxID=41210 RepID=A0A8J4YG53_CHIOP|nr:putative G-protein coupled receptor B0563.6 [Chionoecetes opilio]
MVLELSLRVVYRGVLPVVVALGVVASLATIWVLAQPGLRKAAANRYFLALAAFDLLHFLFYIPILVSACGCTFPNYGSAYYFTHFGWTLAASFHGMGTYTLVLLALDRFVGVWFPTAFKRLQRPPFAFTHRMVAVVVLSVGVHVPFMSHGNVVCAEDENIICSSNTTTCESGAWVSVNGYVCNYDHPWHIAYRHFQSLIVHWLPYALMYVFNVSLVIAVSLGKVRFPRSAAKGAADHEHQGAARTGAQQTKRNKEGILVATMIAMTASYVLFTLPIAIFLTGFADTGTERCKYYNPKEMLRHIGNILQLAERVLHIFFLLLIYPRFRREMMSLVRRRSATTEEGDTTSPDDQRSGSSPLSSALHSAKTGDSNTPPSSHFMESDIS